MAVADIFAATQQVVALLNVGEGASAFNLNVSSGTDGRYSINEIVEAVCSADDDIRLAIRQNPEHWAQSDDLSLSGALGHGDRIPEHVGQVGEVLIQRVSGGDFIPARGVLPRGKIETLRANVGTTPYIVYGTVGHTAAASPLSGFYDISPDGYIRYTGNSAKVRSAGVTRLLRYAFDGAMTSGSATLTSAAGASFAATDVNSLVIVEGARTSSLYPLATVLTQFGSSTSVTLRDSNSSGGSITGKRVTIARLGSPAAYLPAIVRGARGRLWKEGDDTGRAPAFAQAFVMDLQDVKGGARSLPDQLREAA